MKVGILIPTTSHNRNEWRDVKDTYLYKIMINSFISKSDKEHTYIFYIGHDDNDRIFSNKKQQTEVNKIHDIFRFMEFKFIEFKDVKKGHVTRMWNVLFSKAYEDGCDYFFQSGDDIHFKTKGWINDSIKTLQSHNDIGLTGPINNNPRILTQSFVSRKHMDIFGYYMPDEIINWCCDDWYNWVYQPNYFYPLNNHFASNDGGAPRYAINDDKEFTDRDKFNTKLKELRENTMKIAMRDREKIVAYLNR